MAIDYTTLFTSIGRIITKSNAYLDFASNTLTPDRDELTGLIDDAQRSTSDGLYAEYDGFVQDVVRWQERLASYAEAIIREVRGVLDELKIVDDDIDSVLTWLIHQMADDGETVKRSAVQIGGVQKHSANVGSGTVLLTNLLDGYSQPDSGFIAHRLYAGVPTELVVPSETMTLICTGDSQTDGAVEGHERFRWHGLFDYGPWDPRGERSGDGPVISTLNANNLVVNRDFEDWDDDGSPTNWDLDAGTNATITAPDTEGVVRHVNEDELTVHRGQTSMRFDGDNRQSPIQISQDLTVALFQPLRMYCIALWYRIGDQPSSSSSDQVDSTTAVAELPHDHELDVRFAGTGYVAGSTEFISVKDNQWRSGGWTLEHCFVLMPEIIPTDLEIVIRIKGILDKGTSVWIDSLAVGPVSYFGGVGGVVIAGEDRFVREDRFQVLVESDRAGMIQDYFRRQFNVQLPSAGASFETISDELAGALASSSSGLEP